MRCGPGSRRSGGAASAASRRRSTRRRPATGSCSSRASTRSRRVGVAVGSYGQPPCANDYVETEGFNNTAPPPAGPASNDPPVRQNRNYQVKCPNSKNLIEVVGDPSARATRSIPSLRSACRSATSRSRAMAAAPGDVLSRATGARWTCSASTAPTASTCRTSRSSRGLQRRRPRRGGRVHIHNVVARYAQNYGILSFTAVHGLYENSRPTTTATRRVSGSNAKGCNVDPNAYGTCDAGVLGRGPPAGAGPPQRTAQHHSHDNVLGYSGTAGNSTYVHDSDFHDNNTGLTTDSFASATRGCRRSASAGSTTGSTPTTSTTSPPSGRTTATATRSPHAPRRSCARSSRRPSGPAS